MGMSDRTKNFHISYARDAVYTAASRPAYEEGTHGFRRFNEYRDLGLKQATGGKFFAHLARVKVEGDKKTALPFAGGTGIHQHTVDFQFVFVLSGWVRFEIEDHGEKTLHAGDCIYLPPTIFHAVLDYSDDLEVLEIMSPAEYETIAAAEMPGNAAKG